MAVESARLTIDPNSNEKEPLLGNIQRAEIQQKTDQYNAVSTPSQGPRARNKVDQSIKAQPCKLNSYQRRKQVRMENLMKNGVDPETASKIVLKHEAATKNEWVKNNKEKANFTRRKMYANYSKEKKEKIKERKRKEYQKRKSKDLTPIQLQERREKDVVTHSLRGRFQAKVRSNIKKGMSGSKADQAARIYLESLRDRDRIRVEKYRQKKKGESQEGLQQSQ